MDPQLYGQLIFDKAGKNMQWKNDSLFNKWCWENWDSHSQKNETGPFPYTTRRNRLKMDERPKCETGTIKILQENTGCNLFSHSNFFLDTSPKAGKQRQK